MFYYFSLGSSPRLPLIWALNLKLYQLSYSRYLILHPISKKQDRVQTDFQYIRKRLTIKTLRISISESLADKIIS